MFGRGIFEGSVEGDSAREPHCHSLVELQYCLVCVQVWGSRLSTYHVHGCCSGHWQVRLVPLGTYGAGGSGVP